MSRVSCNYTIFYFFKQSSKDWEISQTMIAKAPTVKYRLSIELFKRDQSHIFLL